MGSTLASPFAIQSFTVRHAGAGGESTSWNSRDFALQVSSNGTSWTTTARYVRLNITVPTQTYDNAARIYEVEVYA